MYHTQARVVRILALVVMVFWFSSHPVQAGPLDNVPLHDWTYDALTKVMSYVDVRYPMVTLPLSKAEFADILLSIKNDPAHMEAIRKSKRLSAIYGRLTERFRREMDFQEHGHRNGSFDYGLEALDRVNVYSNAADVEGDYSNMPAGECRDCLHGGINLSHSFWIEKYFGVHMEESMWMQLKSEDGDRVEEGRFEIHRAYAKAQIFNVEVEVGRDSMWWGMGYHGTLLLSDNAPPFDMFRIGSHRPFFLPWYFRYMGKIDLSFFLAQLEENRWVPHPMLMGMRGTVSPTGYLDLAITRTIMHGGEGIEDPSLKGWGKVFLGINEHSFGSAGDTNQFIALEVKGSLAFLRKWIWLPFKELQVGWEYSADSIDSTNTYLPKSIANLWTVYADFGPVDARFEWVDLVSKSPWYDHYVYRDGYTFMGEVIGHPASAGSTERFVQVSGYPTSWLRLTGFWQNRHRKRRLRILTHNTYGLSARFFLPKRIDLYSELKFWHANQSGWYDQYFDEHDTTGWRMELRMETDF